MPQASPPPPGGGFRQALIALDATVGVRWRPDYAGAEPPDTATAAPDAAAIAAAHDAYARALEGAARPEGLARLPAADRPLAEAALRDARDRFGRNTVPLTYLTALVGEAPAAPSGEPEAEAPAPRIATPPPRPAAGTPAAPPPASPPRRDAPEPAETGGGGGRLLAVATGSISLLLVAGIAWMLLRLTGSPAGGTAAVQATPATLPPAATAAASPPDLAAITSQCAHLGSLAPAVPGVSDASAAVLTDPVTSLPQPAVTVDLVAAPAPGSSPFAVIVVVLPYSATPPPAGDVADGAGTVQLIAAWDGHTWHRGLRSWTGTAWSSAVDLAATDVDLAATGATVRLFWSGLGAGARFGEIVTSAQGCAGHDLDAGGMPQQTFSG